MFFAQCTIESAAAFILLDEQFFNDEIFNFLRSGVLNFCAVALSLHSLGYLPLGVRIDSGKESLLVTLGLPGPSLR